MANKLPPFPTPKTNAGKGAAAAALATLAAITGLSLSDAGKVEDDVNRHESGHHWRLEAFQDSVGIWTICGGIITWPDGRRVRQGDTATADQCEAITIQQINERAAPLVRCVPSIKGHPYQVRALVDLSFNVGVQGVCRGAVGTNVRAGNKAAAGRAILAYDRGTFPRPTGRDCVKKKSGPGWSCRIPGLTARRIDNRRMFDTP
jgi:GH24 family phage-related lysozyme (muramidase)